jgi:hypothetical protein
MRDYVGLAPLEKRDLLGEGQKLKNYLPRGRDRRAIINPRTGPSGEEVCNHKPFKKNSCLKGMAVQLHAESLSY